MAAPAFAAEDGKTLYDSKCAVCHGANGVAKIFHEGKGKMKGLGGKAIADDVLTLAK